MNNENEQQNKIMNNENSLNEDNQIVYYMNKALAMILPYNQDEEEMFLKWINKFEYTSDVIGVPENKMLEFFNEMVNKDFQIIIRENNPSVNFSEISYYETIQIYHRYFDDTTGITLNRLRFFARRQFRREPLEKYANSLRKMHNKCFYSSDLEKRLCDQFIKGVRENDIRNHLLQTRGLSFEETVAKAIVFAKSNFITYYLDHVHLMICTYTTETESMFCEWFNRFEYVTRILEVPDDKLLMVFKKMVDNDIHMEIEKNDPSVEFSELSYEEIINYYLQYFSSPNEINVHRKRFMCRNQYEDEGIEEYADNLRKICSKCCYNNIAEKILCKKFVNGIRDEEVRNDLKHFDGLPLSNMSAIAIKFEKINRIDNYLKPALLMINIYNPDKDGIFYIWLNKFEYVANFVKVPNKKMIEFFNKMVHQNVHTSVKQNFSLVNFSELPYEKIISLYLRHFSPNEVDLHVQRFKCRNQYEEESIQNYADDLRKIFYKCVNTNNYEERLCERFINGICDDDVRITLKGLSCLSFDEMVQFAVDYSKFNKIHIYLNEARPMINIYKPKKKNLFYVWLNKFEFVADYIGVAKFQMPKFFNAMVDIEVHRSVKKNYPTVNFSELLYEEIVYRYLRYFSSPNEIYLHRNRFKCRHQYENETIIKYAENLRKLYYKCWYTSNQEEILCEQFFNGIRCDKIKTELKKHSGLSFTEIVQLACKSEEYFQLVTYLDAAISMISIFNPMSKDKFYNWVNRFEYVADSLNVPNNKMVRFFMEMTDYSIHTNIKKSFSSVNFAKLSYEDTLNYYLRYFSGSHETYSHRKRFISRYQYEDETIEKYAKNLRKIFDRCYYNGNYNYRLRKKFLSGIRDSKIRTYLISTPSPTIDDMVAKAIEFTKNNNNSQNE